MFDLITLSALWFFTAGVSLIAYMLKVWDGGIFWFWTWNGVTAIVLGFEAYLYFRYGMTLTRTLTKAETDKPFVAKSKWVSRVIVVCYLIGATCLCIHLWPWK